MSDRWIVRCLGGIQQRKGHLQWQKPANLHRVRQFNIQDKRALHTNHDRTRSNFILVTLVTFQETARTLICTI